MMRKILYAVQYIENIAISQYSVLLPCVIIVLFYLRKLAIKMQMKQQLEYRSQ